MEIFNTVLHSAAGKFYVGDPEIVLSRSILNIRKAGKVIELVPEGVLVDDDEHRCYPHNGNWPEVAGARQSDSKDLVPGAGKDVTIVDEVASKSDSEHDL